MSHGSIISPLFAFYLHTFTFPLAAPGSEERRMTTRGLQDQFANIILNTLLD